MYVHVYTFKQTRLKRKTMSSRNVSNDAVMCVVTGKMLVTSHQSSVWNMLIVMMQYVTR